MQSVNIYVLLNIKDDGTSQLTNAIIIILLQMLSSGLLGYELNVSDNTYNCLETCI